MEDLKKPKTDLEGKENDSFCFILVDFMGYTTGHGFSRIAAATTTVWKVFWTLAVLGAFGMFLVQVKHLFDFYLSKPVQTSITVAFKKELQFPAVTICNLNIVRRSSMEFLPNDVVDKFPRDLKHDVDETKKNLIGSVSTNEKQNNSIAEKPSGDDNVSTTPKEAVHISGKPSEVIDTTYKPTEAINMTSESTEPDNSTGNTTVKTTEKTTGANNTTENSKTTRKQTEDLKTTSGPKPKKRKRREENKEDAKYDKNIEHEKNVEQNEPVESDDNKNNDDKKNNDDNKKYEETRDDDSKDRENPWADWKYGYTDLKKSRSYEDLTYEYPTKDIVDKDTKLRMTIESYIGGELPEKLVKLGHSKESLIKKCNWKGIDCLTGTFSGFWTWSWNYRYGNCYTFNGGADGKGGSLQILTSTKSGPSQGLILELDIEEKEYVGELTEESGVRVVLHEPGSMPFPFEQGFSVAPSMATSVGLTKTEIERLDRFSNGSCAKEGVLLPDANLYRKNKNITRYSLQACLNSCLGESQLKFCTCAEASYPSGKTPCDIFDSNKRECLQMVKFLFNRDELPCVYQCKRPCREKLYEKTISASVWPSLSRREYLEESGFSTYNGSGLLLNIFYSQLNYQIIKETFSYGTTNLLADIGGQLGLWIGISVLTCGELLELIFQLLAIAFKKLKNRRQNQVIQIGNVTN